MTINLMGKTGKPISKRSLRNVAERRQAIIRRNELAQAERDVVAAKKRIAKRKELENKFQDAGAPEERVQDMWENPQAMADHEAVWADQRRKLEEATQAAVDSGVIDEATKAELLNGQEALKAAGAQGDMLKKQVEEIVESGTSRGATPAQIISDTESAQRRIDASWLKRLCVSGQGFLKMGETKMPIKWHRVGACTFVTLLAYSLGKRGISNWSSKDSLDKSEEIINRLRGTQCHDRLPGGKFGPWRKCTEEETAKKKSEAAGIVHVPAEEQVARTQHDAAVEKWRNARRECSKGDNTTAQYASCMKKKGQPVEEPKYEAPVSQKDVGGPFGLTEPEEDK